MTLARLVMPALRAADGGFEHEAARIDEALELGVGGFIIFGGRTDAVRALTTDLVARAGRPLLIGSDLERGAGQQFDGLTEFPPPGALGSLNDLDAIATAAATTAREARSLGINWIFAPDADLDIERLNPIVQSRSFGSDPQRVADAVRVWVQACEATGALACAKHYPGHGRTRTDSHAGLPEVNESAATLEATDAVPFAAAIDAGVAALMTAHVAFPALDPTGTPATRSRPILDHLRQVRGFNGLIVTDALIMDGATVGKSEAEGVVDAIAAGIDVLLYPHDVRAVVEALNRARDAGIIPRERAADALARYERALAHVSRPAPASAPPAGAAEPIADRLLDRGLYRAELPLLTAPIELITIDDDLGGPYAPSPSDWLPKSLAAAGVDLAPGGSRVVIVYAEPRAWKGRAGLSPAAITRLHDSAADAALIILFGHPRLMAELPGTAPVLVAWHRQRLMQEAVGRWLAAALR
ncbi:MAG: glycoside hydrolase family 3 N-terminal domain-containing protein [Gemmatimonadota bacterium]